MLEAEFFGRAKTITVSGFTALNPRQARTYVIQTNDASGKFGLLVTPALVHGMRAGQWFTVFNYGPGDFTILKLGGQVIKALSAGEVADVICFDTTTVNGSWLASKRQFVRATV